MISGQRLNSYLIHQDDVVDENAEPGGRQRRTVALRGLDPRKPPQPAKVLVLLG
jgi:hypothetical protein